MRPSATIADVALPDTPSSDDLTALGQRATEADALILLTCNAHLPRHLAASQTITRALLAACRPLVGVAVADPYDADALPQIPTWLATYDYMPPALVAAARTLVTGG
jgi:hypothetical protein